MKQGDGTEEQGRGTGERNRGHMLVSLGSRGKIFRVYEVYDIKTNQLPSIYV